MTKHVVVVVVVVVVQSPSCSWPFVGENHIGDKEWWLMYHRKMIILVFLRWCRDLVSKSATKEMLLSQVLATRKPLKFCRQKLEVFLVLSLGVT